MTHFSRIDVTLHDFFSSGKSGKLIREVVLEKQGLYCPYCEQLLTDKVSASAPGDTALFWGVLEGKHFSVGSYVRLSSKMGVYGGTFENKDVKMEKGGRLQFHCPHESCRAPLEASYNSELSEVLWFDETGNQHVVAFHNTLGKEMTFVIDPKKGKVIASHGKNAQVWLERWGPFPEWR